MTVLDSEAPAGHDVAAGAERRRGGGAGNEVLLTLEVSGLCAFAFSRPTLDSFGRSPEAFVARGSGPATVVVFGLVVLLVPVAVAGLVGLAGRAGGARGRRWVHLGLVTLVGGLAGWRVGQHLTGWPGDATKLVLAGLLSGPLIAALRARVPISGTFLRYLGATSLIFLAQFLFLSPASSLVTGGGTGVDDEVTQVVSAAIGDDPPPIVFIVTDTFPTQALMDGSGGIDRELYPNLSALAETATWYRNNTTVSAFTNEAVPALLSGQHPDPSPRHQFAVSYPDNLFTLFGGVYDLSVHEPMTRLCPEGLCASTSEGLAPLLGDAVDLWWAAAEPETGKLDIPGLFQPDRYDEFEAWIDAQDFSATGRPGLHFFHLMLPHEPLVFLPDGTTYEASDPPDGLFTIGWGSNGADVGWQRLLLQAQATDRLLGHLFERMRDAGTFDDALIVVAGDHGQAFVAGEPWRAISESNVHQVLWTPLIIKAPHQTAGEVTDENVQTIDVLPTIADRLGFDLPWESDGIVAGGDEPRHPDVKQFDDVDANDLRAEDGQPQVTIDARAGLDALLRADAAGGTGDDAVWQRTAHGHLVGRDLDDLDLGPRTGGGLLFTDLDALDGVDTDAPLPLEVRGFTDEPEDAVVAYVLNGTVAAVTAVGSPTSVGRPVHALLHPAAFLEGDNELAAYVVEGPVGTETLRQLDIQVLG